MYLLTLGFHLRTYKFGASDEVITIGFVKKDESKNYIVACADFGQEPE